MNYLQKNYVPEKLKKLGAESMMENMQMQVKSKGVESVSAMKIYQEKFDRTGNTYEVMMNYLQQKLAHSRFIVIIIMVVILVVFVFISHFGCKICMRKSGFENMKAPGTKTGERISRQKFEGNPRSYFQNLRGKNKKLS
ncbi:Uncharacterized protein Fot_03908 [Forsythia ovata]|uniref:Uncharacterized protein n=1 Tax=Forsythia ovata TaxID=205694 RepID=A0ABD1XB17_9LAMI